MNKQGGGEGGGEEEATKSRILVTWKDHVMLSWLWLLWGVSFQIYLILN